MTLREYLSSKGISPTQFAVALDVHKTTMTRWVNKPETCKPRWDQLEKLVVATDGKVTPNDFLVCAHARRFLTP